jgi:large subunit ribosomal protein L13
VKTYIPTEEESRLDWKLVDAEGCVLGRLASRVARILTGKDSPQYTPFLAMGSAVIIINAEKIRLTGKKLGQKVYRHYTGYPGGVREIRADRLMAKWPERVVREAVLGMLPKNRLGSRIGRRLRVYRGSVHPHAGQKPDPVQLRN